MRKLLLAAILLMLSLAAFYCSLFWGWASGAGVRNQPHLKFASNIALAVSFVAFWSSVALWLVPLLRKKKKEESQ